MPSVITDALLVTTTPTCCRGLEIWIWVNNTNDEMKEEKGDIGDLRMWQRQTEWRITLRYQPILLSHLDHHDLNEARAASS